MYYNFANLFSKCRKALFTRKKVSFSKTYRVKVLDKAFCEGFPNYAAHIS